MEVIKINMTINDYQELIQLLVTNLGNYDLVIIVLWTSSYILYGLPLHQKGDVSKATC